MMIDVENRSRRSNYPHIAVLLLMQLLLDGQRFTSVRMIDLAQKVLYFLHFANVRYEQAIKRNAGKRALLRFSSKQTQGGKSI